MGKSFLDLLKSILPLNKEQQSLLALCAPHLDAEEYKDLKYFLRTDKLFGTVKNYGASPGLGPVRDAAWPEFKTHVGGPHVRELAAHVNKKVKESIDEELFSAFAADAPDVITKLIANNIVGVPDEKFAAALILFAKEPFHILLLGDPGTGKTEILRSVAAFAPKGSFGLGSGTSGVGLAATFKGGELLKGLLPQADKGVACIDELNLMKTKDRASLYSAMEKGFITYDKGGRHEQLDARVRVLATANPKGDQFVGSGAAVLRKQLPFAQALLSRFHLLFLIRRPNPKQLGKIAGQIVRQEKQRLKQGDVEFVKAYAAWALKKDVLFSKQLEPIVVKAIEQLAEDEPKFLVEIGPRTAVGIIRMAKAYARMRGKEEVGKEDLSRILALVRRTLYVRK